MADDRDHTIAEDAPSLSLVREELTVAKAEVVSDRVRVTTAVDTREEVVRDTLARGVLKVERIAVEGLVDAPPPLREEGATTIVSLVEERLVVEKRLFVVEEVRITRERTAEQVAVPVTLRTTRATIERPMGEPTTGSTTDGRR